MIVLDASLVVARLLREQDQNGAPDIYDLLSDSTILVPGHWPVEVANALRTNVRNGRISYQIFDQILAELSTLDIFVDAPVSIAQMGHLTRFALNHGLTTYDALYLQLAADRNVPLGTIDRAMRVAAQKLSIALIPA